MIQPRLAWHAFKNMLRAAARDPVWAIVSLIALPFRAWKPLMFALFIVVVVLYVVGMGGRLALKDLGYGPGTVPFIALDLATVALLALVAFRLLSQPLILNFAEMGDDGTHGTARFATNKEVAPLHPIRFRPPDRPRRQVWKAAAL